LHILIKSLYVERAVKVINHRDQFVSLCTFLSGIVF
jgi:hypothetical protein